MAEKYLYERLVEEFGKRTIAQTEIPSSLKDNLNRNFELRSYQIEAFQRFICYYKNDLDFKERPSHLLFNMATGSGKTLIMAGLILYLYEQGYRNFLFFVNSTNIIEKTKDNFLNPASIKYLFNSFGSAQDRQEITIGNRRLRVNPVENFEGVNQNEINICFTTIQKLHSDLTTQKENAITFEDFRKYKVVLIADEAHHMSATTQEQAEVFRPTWENTVQTIFEKNAGNLLLEFTATHDYTNSAMVNKYRNKVIFRYDLPEFRNDRFSKDVTLVYSDFDLDERICREISNQFEACYFVQGTENHCPVAGKQSQFSQDYREVERKANCQNPKVKYCHRSTRFSIF
jgi:type III restriction enzyme